jgi:predicted ATP-dependent serine protease
LTHDYNDSGFKAGGLTLLTGRRNQGKTTFARQIMIAVARQQMGVFAYMGEGEMEREKGYLERLIAKEGELVPFDNTYGRVDYLANEVAEARFNREIAPYIDFYNKPLNLKGSVFNSILSEMTVKARQGSVLFVIDNMMKLTADQKEVFKAQQNIIAKLKEFAVHFKVHIILIAHPRKDGTSISGAMEQENTADTILKFNRVFSSISSDSISEPIPQKELDRVTAQVTNEKVRDGGVMYTMYMEFDPIRQANIDIVYQSDIYQMAHDYKQDGYYSRPVIRIDDI